MIGALDHAVMAVSGETFADAFWAGTGASAIMVSPLTFPGGGTGAGAVGARVTWGCPGNWRGGSYVLEANEGSGQAGRRNYRRTIFNNIGDGWYHPPSGWYGSVVAEVPKDLSFC